MKRIRLQRGWRARALAALALLGAGLLVACGSVRNDPATATAAPPFRNPFVVPEDTGQRAPLGYFLHRAWVQLTRDLARTDVPPTVPLNLEAMAGRPFAVAWLGHSAMLMRVGGLWVLIDPALSDTAGPVAGLGPARLTQAPLAWGALPRIDVVLTSHDHFDHLDLATVRRLARQAGGAPRFFAGLGLAPWFEDAAKVRADTFAWWETRRVGEVRFRFVPAQHNSGRSLWARNATLWGGWVVEHEVDGQVRRFYFAGDTAYVPALFQDLRARLGPFDLAALPIGAYLPREAMRFEHTDPDDAVRAHLDLGSPPSFGVHWGSFQLGDDEPFQAATDLARAVRRHGVERFGLLPVGGVVDVGPGAAVPAGLLAPERLRPVSAASVRRAARQGDAPPLTPAPPGAPTAMR